MTNAEISKWLANLKNDIGQSQYQPLWHYAEALDIAIKALDDQRWIPVSELLPDVDEDVLVTDDAGGLATVHDDSCGRYEDTGEKFWYTSQNVTAWMPFPKPYMED